MLSLFDLLLLIPVRGEGEKFPLFFLLHKITVVAGILGHPAETQLIGFRRHGVEEAAVVRDNNHRAFIRLKIFLKPLQRVKIEMVCRFVEQQQGWLNEEEFCERNTHLPPAAELSGLPIHVIDRKAETEQDLLDLCFHPERIAVFELVLQFAVKFEQLLELVTLVVGNVIHPLVNLIESVLRIEHVAKCCFYFPVQRTTLDMHPFLREVADRDVFCFCNFTLIG